MASTKDVLDRHLAFFGEGDLKGILSDYAPGAVLFTPDGPLRGADAIRPFFETLIAEFGKPDSAFRMKHQSVEGDHAYILWTAETADKVYELGTDMFVVRVSLQATSQVPILSARVYDYSSSSAFASRKSTVSKPSVKLS